MAFFKRKPKILDLTEHYHKQQEKVDAMKEEAKESSDENSSTSSAFGFLGNLASSASPESDKVIDPDGYLDVSGDASEKRKKLAKRIVSMTDKMEEISNQIYHLEQRLEVLEKKLGSSSY